MMNFKEIMQSPLWQKTFGGLTKAYYVRQFILAAVMAAALLWLPLGTDNEITVGFALWLIVNTVLYPYSRFVYETVTDFILGNNVFILPTVVLLPWKLVTMLLCFAFAIFVAPVGLAGIYIYLTNQEKKIQSAEN